MNHEDLDGASLKHAHLLIELMNGGPEPGRPTKDVKELFQTLTKGKKPIGRVFITSTVEDMSENANELHKLWESDAERYGLQPFKR